MSQKETRYWHIVIEQAVAAFAENAPQTKLWFVMGREADCCTTLRKLLQTEHWFTIRACRNRCVAHGGRKMRLRDLMARQPIVAELGGYTGKSSGGPPGTITITRGLSSTSRSGLRPGRGTRWTPDSNRVARGAMGGTLSWSCPPFGQPGRSVA